MYIYKQALPSLRSLVGYIQPGDNRTNMITFQHAVKLIMKLQDACMHAVLRQARIQVYFMVKPHILLVMHITR